MQLDGILRNPLLSEELEDLGSLISLKLNNSPHILILYQRPVACKLLLELFQDLLIIVFYTDINEII
jgi:hypothetical protein